MLNFELLKPELDYLPRYEDALKRGWSPDNVRRDKAAKEQLEKIHESPAEFVNMLDDPDARGRPVKLPDGSYAPRLPGIQRWMWDGDFCGVIGFRWQNGTSSLPKHVLGHIGFAVVPWKRGRGYATRALALMLPEARSLGLAFVEITTDPENIPSQRVILANGGEFIEGFRKDVVYGGSEALRYRIYLG